MSPLGRDRRDQSGPDPGRYCSRPRRPALGFDGSSPPHVAGEDLRARRVPRLEYFELTRCTALAAALRAWSPPDNDSAGVPVHPPPSGGYAAFAAIPEDGLDSGEPPISTRRRRSSRSAKAPSSSRTLVKTRTLDVGGSLLHPDRERSRFCHPGRPAVHRSPAEDFAAGLVFRPYTVELELRPPHGRSGVQLGGRLPTVLPRRPGSRRRTATGTSSRTRTSIPSSPRGGGCKGPDRFFSMDIARTATGDEPGRSR